MFTCMPGCCVPQSWWYPNLLEGVDSIGGQLHGDKECPFSGVTNSGRIWNKVPESDVQSVASLMPDIKVMCATGKLTCHFMSPLYSQSR